MSEWTRKTIAECAANEPYSTQIGPFGKALTPEEYTLSGVPLLRGVNVNHGRFYDDGFVFISEETADRLYKYESYPGDVLLVHKGTLGQIGLMPHNRKYHRYIMGNSMLRVRCDETKLIPEYLYYWLCSREGQHYLFSRVSQVGVPQIQKPLATLREASLLVPPIDEQKSITRILETLDTKIENLRRQNETLEKIAQTLFKHWFIDFEFPNDDGKPYKSSGGAMVASELGNIPEGWRVGKLGDYINIQHGYNFKSEDFADDGNPIVRMGNFLINGGLDFQKEKTKFFSGNINQKFILQANDLVVALSDVTQNGLILGNPGFIPSDNRKYLLNQRVGKVFINNFVNKIFLYCLMKTKTYKNWVKNSANSTTVLNTSPSRIGELLCALPLNNELLDKLEILLKPIFFKNENNIKQIQTLIKTRDALLPKLMSGQIRVKD